MHASTQLKQTRKKASRTRLAVVTLAIVLLLAGLAYLALLHFTRGGAARTFMLGQLSGLVDADLDLDRASIGLDGRIVLSDVSVRLRDVPGTAGEVLSARTVRIQMRGLFSGSPVVERLSIEDPVVRISQSVDNGSLNLRELRFVGQDQATGAPLPAIEITGGVIELGEHTAAAYSILRRIPIRGTLNPSSEKDSYEFEVIHGLGGSDDSRLSGRIMSDDVEVMIDELDLGSWPNEAVPTRYRELHRRLALQGLVEPTRVVINRTTGFEIMVRLSNVELTLPLDELPMEHSRMTNVSGSIRLDANGFDARVLGLLDGVPTTALISGPDASLASAFECAISVGRVQLTESLGRLSYLPPYVREQLQIFSNPVAQVELDLVFNRARDAGSDIDVSGEIRLFNGVASYRDFPYEFVDMEGVFLLDADRLTIKYVRGRSPNGAMIEAEGWVGPLGDDAEAKISVRATDVPLDAKLRAGLSTQDQKLFDSLLSRIHYQGLIDTGHIITTRQARLWTSELNRLRAQLRRNEIAQGDIESAQSRALELDALLQTPAFEMGGVGTVTVEIHRHYGIDSRWDTEVRVELPNVGFVPEYFPLPIQAEQVAIRIIDGVAELTNGKFLGLEGGVAHVTARAELDSEERTSDVEITARDVPITPMLIAALPEPNADDGATSVRNVLRQLGLVGIVDCNASFTQRETDVRGLPSSLAVEIIPRGVKARPVPINHDEPVGLELAEIEGAVRATGNRIELALSAQAVAVLTGDDGELNREEASFEPSLIEANVVLALDAASGQPGLERTRVRSHSFDLSLPIENLVSVVDAEAAHRVANLRAAHDPTGRIDAEIARDDANTPVILTMRHGRDITFKALDHRFGFSQTTGVMTLARGERTLLKIDSLSGPLDAGGETVGTVTISGHFDVENLAGQADIAVDGARIESAAAALVVSHTMPALTEWWREQRPHGMLDLRFRLETDEGGQARAKAIEIRPRAFTFGSSQPRLNVLETMGTLNLDDGRRGHLNGLQLQGDGWSATLDGSFEILDQTGFDANLNVEVEALGIPHELRALAPPAFASVLDGLTINAAGPTLVRNTQVLIGNRPAGLEFNAVGEVVVENASASIGLDMTELDGRIAYAVHQHPSFESPRFELHIAADRLRIAGVWMRGAECPVRSSLDGEAVEVGPFSATSHDGRVFGSAVVWQDKDDNKPRFDLHAMMSSVRLSPVLRDLALDTDEPDPTEAADESRGVIDAQLTLYGEIDGARRGLGQIQVSQGRVLRLPLLVPLIEVSNLQLPRGELLDIARAQFYILNDALTLEELSVLSRSIELLGYGTMSIASQELDLRINSRAVRRIPLVSEVLDSIRDELVTVRVEGTVRSPKIRTEQFMTTRRAVLSLLGWEPNEQEKLLRDIKQRAMRYRDRARLSSEQISRVVDIYSQPSEPLYP